MANALGVTFEDVNESYEEEIDTDDRAWVERKIDEATRELVSLIPDLVPNISALKVDAQLAKDKVIAAVLRVVRNPGGIEQEQEGDYNIRLRNLTASGDMWFPEKDLLQLGWQGKQKQATPRTVRVRPTSGWSFP